MSPFVFSIAHPFFPLFERLVHHALSNSSGAPSLAFSSIILLYYFPLRFRTLFFFLVSSTVGCLDTLFKMIR